MLALVWLTSALMAVFSGQNRANEMCSQSPELVTLKVSAPALSGTITRLDLSWFNLEQDGTSPVFFTSSICNGGEDTARVRMIVAILVTPTDPALAAQCGAGGCWAEQQITKVFEVPPHSTKLITSKDLYSSDFEPGGYTPANAPFRKLLTQLGRIPPSNVSMFFGLTCPQNKVGNRVRGLGMAELAQVVSYNHMNSQIITSEYRPFDGVNLLQPGAAGAFPEIYNPTPLFSFQSELSDAMRFDYKNDRRFQLQLWKVLPGETQGQSLARRPDESLDLDASMVSYPSNWAPLQAGSSYLWRVQARDRGPVTGWLSSEAFGFRVASLSTTAAADPAWLASLEGLSADQLRLLRALARVLGDRVDVLEKAVREGKVDPASLTLDGKAISITALEEMATDFEAGKNTVTRAGTP
jgi:hypothetical protein